MKQEIQDLIKARNYIGAIQAIKESHFSKTEESIHLGALAEAIVADLDASRTRNERERVHYLRAALAWCLHEYPAMSALYREETTTGRSLDIADQVSRATKNVGDVLTGKVSLEAGIKEGMEQVGKQAEEMGLPLERMVQEGVSRVSDFLSSLTGISKDATVRTPESEKTAPRPAEPSEEADAEPAMKVTIENGDAPLPGNIKKADKARDDS